MPHITESKSFAIRAMSPDEWRSQATGDLSLPPGFWEGPGAHLTEAKVTPLGAFYGARMLGYIAVREVPLGTLTPETKAGLIDLVERRRRAGVLGAGALAAIESADTPEDEIAAHNIGFALVGERGGGVGTSLTQAALRFAGRNATPNRPMPAYLSVATINPARRLYERLGFEPVLADGSPIARTHDYYPPPTRDGEFEAPTQQPHIILGTVETGSTAP